MRRFVAALASATVLGAMTAMLLAQAPLPKVLYLTHSAGFKHDVVPLSEQILVELGKKHNAFDVTVTQDLSVLSARGLAPYSAVVFYTTGELDISEQQKTEFMRWIRAGNGFVGVHSATDTFYKWPEYGEMIGGYFDEHPWNTEVRIKVERRDHPATKHLGDTWTIADEIYQFRNWSRQNQTVLLSLDTASVDMKAKGVKRTDGDFGIAWHRNWGNGRVFYTALGHRPEVWKDPTFQQHLVAGILWAIGDDAPQWPDWMR
jgi:uncharacterized protein